MNRLSTPRKATSRSSTADDLASVLAGRRLPSTEQRRTEFQKMMRYRSALGMWWAQLLAAGQRGEAFDRPRPQPADFDSRY